MKKILLLLTLNLFLLFPVFPQASIDIPVVSEKKEKNILNRSQKKFENSENSVEDPITTNSNTEIISAQSNKGTTPTTKSVKDVTSQITSGQVQQYGGENGVVQIHLRGARAFEPSFYFNGLPLTSALNGEQNFNLLPASFIASLYVYPDTSPFTLGSMGISGDVDIISCRKNSCFSTLNMELQNEFKISSTAGPYHYKKLSFSHAYSLSKQTNTFSTLEWTKSLEDYLVFNNNNSSLYSDVGRYENLQNNDFTSIGAASAVSHFYAPLGKINLDIAFGSKEQGIAGAVGIISTTRLKQNILVGTLRTEKLFPENGVRWDNQIGGMFNSSQISSILPTFSNQGSVSRSYSFQAKSLVIIPTEFILKEQTGFAFELLNNSSVVKTTLASNSLQTASETNANRLEYRSSYFEGLIYNINDNMSISSDINTWFSGAQDNSKATCNSALIQNNCIANSTLVNRSPLYGYTLSLQSKIYFFIPYIRYTSTQRRAYLVELYGSPGGILPNSNLENEESKKEEFGVNFPFGDIGIFHADDKNLIFLEQASPVTQRYINLQSGTRDAYFLDLNYNFTSYWEATLNYQYLNSKMRQNNETFIVPRSPKHMANFMTSLKNIPLIQFLNHQIKFASYFSTQYESSFYMDTANINEMNVPNIYNAGLSFIFDYPNHKIILSLDAFNLTDKKFSVLYNSSGYVLQVNSNGYLGIPPPGRRFYASLSGEF